MIYVMTPMSRRSRHMGMICCDAPTLPSDYRSAIIPALDEAHAATSFRAAALSLALDLIDPEDQPRYRETSLEAALLSRRAREIHELLQEFRA